MDKVITIEVNNVDKEWNEDKISGNDIKDLAGVELQSNEAYQIKKNEKEKLMDDVKKIPVKEGYVYITESKDSGVKQG